VGSAVMVEFSLSLGGIAADISLIVSIMRM
jgi:hypothetical protein